MQKNFDKSVERKSYWYDIQSQDGLYRTYPYVSGEFTPSECHIRNGHIEKNKIQKVIYKFSVMGKNIGK